MQKILVPLGVSILLLIAYGVAHLNPTWLGAEGERYLLAGWLISLSAVIARTINYVLLDVTFRKLKGREAPALLHVILSLVVYAGFIALILSQILKRDLSGIAATSAVVTVVLGIALQDTLGNFFAGISIHVEEPFHIGDAIKVGDLIGRVEAVTWRTTTIRTNDNTLVIFPNSKVARDPVEVFPLNHLNRRVLKFPAPVTVLPHQIISMVKETLHALPDVAQECEPVVRIAAFAESSITYEVLYWVKDYMTVLDVDARLRERILYVYNRHAIEVPYPHMQVLYDGPSPEVDEQPDYISLLNKVGILDPLDEEERDEVSRELVRRVYAPQEVILRHGDPGDSMFIIRRGTAEVSLTGTNGSRPSVATLGAGDFFGEMALFTGERRTADVRALDAVEILEIRKDTMEHLLEANTALAEAFSSKIAERQTHLQEHALRAPEEQIISRESILQRMKRFFSLS